MCLRSLLFMGLCRLIPSGTLPMSGFKVAVDVDNATLRILYLSIRSKRARDAFLLGLLLSEHKPGRSILNLWALAEKKGGGWGSIGAIDRDSARESFHPLRVLLQFILLAETEFMSRL